MKSSENFVLLAVIGAAHGIEGALKVRSFTADPAALGNYGKLQTRDGGRLTVTSLRPTHNGLIVRFKEVEDRTAAERLAGTELFVDRSALPDDLDTDEFYHADLIGLDVRSHDGAMLGKVAAIHDFGAGDVVEINSERGGPLMVPFSLAAIPKVHIAKGFIVVDRQAAGLDDAAERAKKRQ